MILQTGLRFPERLFWTDAEYAISHVGSIHLFMTDLLFNIPLSYDNARESDKVRSQIIKGDGDDNETGKAITISCVTHARASIHHVT